VWYGIPRGREGDLLSFRGRLGVEALTDGGGRRRGRAPGAAPAPFVGTISVEYSLTATYAPCIANVYVHPTLRRFGFGFGGVLMTFAERFLKRQAMSAAYLWCDPGLVGYYERRAYKVVDVPTGGYKEVRFMGEELIAR